MQHIQLVGHFVVDGPLSSDDVLGRWFTEKSFEKRKSKQLKLTPTLMPSGTSAVFLWRLGRCRLVELRFRRELVRHR